MMKQFVFREDLAERHLEQRIRKALEIKRLAGIEQLCRDTEAPAKTVRALLDKMIERREVERLRPLRYEKDDLDYFKLRESQRQRGDPVWHCHRRDRRRGWLDHIQLSLRPPGWVRHNSRLVKSLT